MATELQGLREFPRAPVRRAVGRRLPRPRQDASLEARRQHGRRVAAIAPVQAGHPRVRKAPLPLADRPRALAEAPGDRAVGIAGGQAQHDTRPPGEIRATAASPRQRLQGLLFVVGEYDVRQGLWHAPHYTITSA
jgi:hypothetical protein